VKGRKRETENRHDERARLPTFFVLKSCSVVSLARRTDRFFSFFINNFSENFPGPSSPREHVLRQFSAKSSLYFAACVFYTVYYTRLVPPVVDGCKGEILVFRADDVNGWQGILLSPRTVRAIVFKDYCE